ncbi:MAG: hypothetical protein PHF25_09060 [Candidatus Margulisbacteria bacterium]|nr:hypothetical protein [Candidatus Margulisiibacteriota bacterium]
MTEEELRKASESMRALEKQIAYTRYEMEQKMKAMGEKVTGVDLSGLESIGIPDLRQQTAVLPLATIADVINGKTYTATITDGGKKTVLSHGAISLEIRDNYPTVIHKADGTIFEMKDVMGEKLNLSNYRETLGHFLDNDFKQFMDKYVAKSLIEWGYVAKMDGNKVSIKNNGLIPTCNVTFDFYNGKIAYNNLENGSFVDIPFGSLNMKQIDMTQIDSIAMQNVKKSSQLIAMATMLKVSNQLRKDRAYLDNCNADTSSVKSAKGNGHFSDDQVFRFAQMAKLAYGKRDNGTFYDFSSPVAKNEFLTVFASILGGSYSGADVDLLANKDYVSGYSGYIIKDKKTGQVYMLHRGTEDADNDRKTDVALYAGLDLQSKDSLAMYNSVLSQITGPVIHIGHSLGGGLANIMAAKNHNFKNKDVAVGFNSVGVWGVLKPKDSAEEAYYREFIENYLVVTDVVGSVLPQVGRVLLEKAPEGKPSEYALNNYFNGAILHYNNKNKVITFDGNNIIGVLRGIVSFILGGYAGTSHALSGTFWSESVDYVKTSRIDGVTTEELDKYKEEIIRKYWTAYKGMKGNKLGEESSIGITKVISSELGIKLNLIDLSF